MIAHIIIPVTSFSIHSYTSSIQRKSLHEPRIPNDRMTALHMSFVADGSDYSSSESDYEDVSDPTNSGSDGPGFNPLAMDAPTIEEEPVPLSKNAGSRFIAFVWDHLVDTKGRDMMELHNARVERTTDHIMHCRKANLFNETFNYNSMADVVWSYPL